jgi:hypothetical protein
MSNDVTTYEPDPIEDDGFNGSIKGFRGTSYLRWTAAEDWTDRDGITPPSPLLVVAVDEILKMWKDNVPTIISEKPLPDPDELNAAIDPTQWETGKDGTPRPPWAHNVCVLLVNVATGESYTYQNSTVGAHIAYDHLKEQVIIMRSLRGEKVMPIVNLTKRPMRTKFGMTTRPHFEIIGWQSPGGGGDKALPDQSAPQLSGPVAAAAPAAEKKTASASSPMQPVKSSGKPAINLNAGNVKPVTTEELLNDKIPSFD